MPTVEASQELGLAGDQLVAEFVEGEIEADLGTGARHS